MVVHMLASLADGEYFAQLILAFKNERIPLKGSFAIWLFLVNGGSSTLMSSTLC